MAMLRALEDFLLRSRPLLTDPTTTKQCVFHVAPFSLVLYHLCIDM
jgi:hypothetical protein